MDRVEGAGLRLRQSDPALGDDGQSAFLEALVDRAVRLRRVASGLMIERVRWVAMGSPPCCDGWPL